LEGKKGSWNVYYNFDQYLYEPKKEAGEGFGLFGRFGASDGNPNFMHYFYSLGLGGKVVIGRSQDRYGLGFYYLDVSNPTFRGLFQDRKLLHDEYGFEAFYNVAITLWLQLTPDVQIVRGAQKDKFTIRRGPLGVPFIATKRSIGTAIVRIALEDGVLRRGNRALIEEVDSDALRCGSRSHREVRTTDRVGVMSPAMEDALL
jgi:porin